MFKTVSTIISAIILSSFAASAQEAPEPQKRENVKYYTMEMVDFKAGKNAEGYAIIYDHFVPVDRKLGREVHSVDIQTGGWDHVVFFHIDGVASEYEWSLSRADAEWWAALVEQEGSAEAAEELMDRFQGLIARSSSNLTHIHQPEPEEE